ncbi:MAG: effector-associated domain EAD1-containing protein [Cyanobacteria bacterium J06560_2]
MELNGRQIDRLTQALQEAYPEESNLKQLLRYELDEKLQNIAKGTHTNLAFQVFEWAEEKSWQSKLIRAAHRRNPSNAQMREFCLSVEDALLKDAIAENFTGLSSQDIESLIAGLRQDDIPFESIERSAIAALPAGAHDNSDDADYRDLKGTNLLPVMRLCGLFGLFLTKYPKTPEGEPRLLCFAQALQEALGATSQMPLSAWIEQHTVAAASASVSLPQRRHPTQLAGTLQVSLMVTITLSTESTAEQLRYLVEGYLYFDQLGAQPDRELPPLQALSLPETDTQLGVDCTWKQVKSYVAQYFEAANDQLARLQQELCFDYYELFVEIFLPFEKLGDPVDQWLCRVSSRRQEPLGTENGVIVRISDRLHDGSLRFNAWKKSWARLQAFLAPPSSVTSLDSHVESVQDFSRSWSRLQHDLRQSFGLKLCCGLPNRAKERVSLFDAVFHSDTSLALWTRSCSLLNPNDDAPLDISDELVPFLEVNGIQNMEQLAAKLTSVRQAARAEVGNDKEGQCLGDHLAFLLDNPDRLPLLSQY